MARTVLKSDYLVDPYPVTAAPFVEDGVALPFVESAIAALFIERVDDEEAS